MKDGLIIAGLCIAAAVVAAWLFFGTPHSQVNTGPQVAFSVITTGTNASGVISRTNYLIRNQQELAGLWQMLYGNASGMPQIDFSKNEIIAVFAGSEPTTGYRIQVATVQDAAGERMVGVNIGKPASSCAVGESITNPFEVISVPKTDLPYTHKDSMVTVPCNG